MSETHKEKKIWPDLHRRAQSVTKSWLRVRARLAKRILIQVVSSIDLEGSQGSGAIGSPLNRTVLLNDSMDLNNSGFSQKS